VKLFRARYNRHEDRDVWFFPPALSVEAAAQAARDRADLLVGIQDIYWKPKGASRRGLSPARPPGRRPRHTDRPLGATPRVRRD